MAYISLSRPPRPNRPVESKIFPIHPDKATSERFAVLTLPFDFPAGDRLDPILQAQLQTQFNAEVETGLTYPYEHTLSPEGFQAYFLSFDFVLGLFLTSDQAKTLGADGIHENNANAHKSVTISSDQLARVGAGDCKVLGIPNLSEDREGSLDISDWYQTYAFSYYIKPNYPGRSGHICNAGFIVSAKARGQGLGSIAGLSYLYYGPACGYLGSVFNLVYASNQASARIWQRLGFQTVGTVPKAGRLKTNSDGTEEFVDALVVYGDFAKIGLLD